ncbi:hypothetical protein HK100_000255 [Physocladia obscura]|uniref:Xylanolytic transcriptional activator regulatory domain-containing protein n=1 Tax=Physocladia obscura TaxID=109957 RepID=A0AAD5T036_9FUNG|nr:hypothetical protein HK100_000255 [Physocladia obscura]
MDSVSQLPKDAPKELIAIYFEHFDPSVQSHHYYSIQFMHSQRDIRHIQAFSLLMFSHSGGSGPVIDGAEVNVSRRISASWMYSGMAVSQVKEIRRGPIAEDYAATDSVNSNTVADWLENEQRKRLWWTCYFEDRFAAAASDRPIIVFVSDCSIFSLVLNKNGFAASAPTTLSNSEIISGNPMTPQPSEFTSNTRTEIDLKTLELALQSWKNSLPNNFKILAFEISSATSAAEKTEIYVRANLQIYYRVCVILLHKPKLMNQLRKPQQQSSQPSQINMLARLPCFMACHTAACEIMTILQSVRCHNPHMTHFMPFVTAVAIFQSALVHLISGQVVEEGGVAAVKATQVHLGLWRD